MRGAARVLACWGLMLGTVFSAPEPSAPAGVGAGGAGEYDIKAAFLRNFVIFVEWPDAAMGAKDAPIVVGVFDPTPFGNAFSALQGKTVKRRTIKIRVCRSIGDAQGCHVVFVNPRQPNVAAAVLGGLRDQPVLTVGETPGFLQGGGIIRFVRSGERVRLEINLEAARGAGLSISSQLLELAKVVDNVSAR